MDTADAKDVEENDRGAIYIYGFGFFFGFFLLITFWYISYVCKGYMRTRTRSPSPDISLVSTTHDANNHHHIISISRGLDDDILVTFPTFAYSEDLMPHSTDANTSGCSICLADYKQSDVIRLLPECGHLFHVKCIDTWLKVHPTCPMCRNLFCFTG